MMSFNPQSGCIIACACGKLWKHACSQGSHHCMLRLQQIHLLLKLLTFGLHCRLLLSLCLHLLFFTIRSLRNCQLSQDITVSCRWHPHMYSVYTEC